MFLKAEHKFFRKGGHILRLPISYGKIEEFRYKKGDPDWDLKVADRTELKLAFQKSQDTLWAGGKRAPTTAFDEFAKIIFVKIISIF